MTSGLEFAYKVHHTRLRDWCFQPLMTLVRCPTVRGTKREKRGEKRHSNTPLQTHPYVYVPLDTRILFYSTVSRVHDMVYVLNVMESVYTRSHNKHLHIMADSFLSYI